MAEKAKEKENNRQSSVVAALPHWRRESGGAGGAIAKAAQNVTCRRTKLSNDLSFGGKHRSWRRQKIFRREEQTDDTSYFSGVSIRKRCAIAAENSERTRRRRTKKSVESVSTVVADVKTMRGGCGSMKLRNLVINVAAQCHQCEMWLSLCLIYLSSHPIQGKEKILIGREKKSLCGILNAYHISYVTIT